MQTASIPYMLLVLSLILFWTSALVFAGSVNITIDDTYGDPVTGAQFTYSPADEWTAGQTCTSCTARPDPSEAYNGTWHDTSFFPSEETTPTNASISFKGTAVYVYCILYQTSSTSDAQSYMQFMLDGEVLGSFIKPESTSSGITYSYNYLVYANDQLPLQTYTFTLINGQQGGDSPALTLLDYLVYTAEDADASPSNPITSSSSTSSNPITSPSSTSSNPVASSSNLSPSSSGTLPIVSDSGAASSVITHSPTAATAAGTSTGHQLTARTRDIVIAISVVGGTLFLAIATLALRLRHRRRNLVSSSNEGFNVHENAAFESANETVMAFGNSSTVATWNGESRIPTSADTIHPFPRGPAVTSGRLEKQRTRLTELSSPVSNWPLSPLMDEQQLVQSVEPSRDGSEDPPPYHSRNNINGFKSTRI